MKTINVVAGIIKKDNKIKIDPVKRTQEKKYFGA